MYEYNGQSVYPLSDVAAMFGVSAGLPNHWLKRGNYGLAEGKDYTIISGKVYKQLTGRNVSAKEPICVIYQSGVDKIKRFRLMTVPEDSNRGNDNKKSGAKYTVEEDELIKAASRLGAKNVQISRFLTEIGFPRSEESIKCRKTDIGASMPQDLWTDEEVKTVEVLMENGCTQTMICKAFVNKYGVGKRSESAIRTKIRKICKERKTK